MIFENDIYSDFTFPMTSKGRGVFQHLCCLSKYMSATAFFDCNARFAASKPTETHIFSDKPLTIAAIKPLEKLSPAPETLTMLFICGDT